MRTTKKNNKIISFSDCTCYNTEYITYVHCTGRRHCCNIDSERP